MEPKKPLRCLDEKHSNCHAGIDNHKGRFIPVPKRNYPFHALYCKLKSPWNLVILVYFKDFLGIFKGFLSIGSRGRCTFWWIISPRPGAQPPNIDIPIKAPQNKCCRHKALFLQEWEREFISQHLYFEIFLQWSYYDSAFCDSQTLNSQVGGWKLLLAKDCFQNARLPN